jgi:hypothetical protein
MKPTHLLAGLLMLAALLVDLVLVSHLETAPDTAFLLLWGVACGQLALLAMWSVLGATAWLIRLLAVLAVAAFLSAPLAAATHGRWSEWFLVLCLFAGLVGLPLVLARWSGLCARVTSEDGSRGERTERLRRCQYSLGGLWSLLTTVGLLCGMRPFVAFPWQHALVLASYGACLTLVALGSMWAMVSHRAVGTRLAVLTLLCLAAGWAMNSAELARNVWFFATVALLETAVICFGINVCLTGGLHIQVRRGTD